MKESAGPFHPPFLLCLSQTLNTVCALMCRVLVLQYNDKQHSYYTESCFLEPRGPSCFSWNMFYPSVKNTFLSSFEFIGCTQAYLNLTILC